MQDLGLKALLGRADFSQLKCWADHRKRDRVAARLQITLIDASEVCRQLRQVALDKGHEKLVEPQRVEVDEDKGMLRVSGDGNIRTLDQLLDASDVDQDRWAVRKWVTNTWGKECANWQVKAWLEKIPSWMVDPPVQPVKSLPRIPSKGPKPTTETAMFIPDSQNGYHWSEDHQRLIPMHDRRAWDLAVQAAKMEQPAHIILLGDMGDLPGWTDKYTRSQHVRYLTGPWAREMYWWLAQLRQAAPSAEIHYIEGNHEKRLNNAIQNSLSEAEGLRPANEVDGPPLLSIERLLALDSLDVQYHGPYPNGRVWLWDQVRTGHGTTVGAGGGDTVAKLLKTTERYCIVQGHVHRAEIAFKTTHGHDGSRLRWAMSPGCIARVDDQVVPPCERANWQQALGWVKRTADDGKLWPELTLIQDGRMRVDGIWLEGVDRSEEIAEATGYAQMVWQ